MSILRGTQNNKQAAHRVMTAVAPELPQTWTHWERRFSEWVFAHFVVLDLDLRCARREMKRHLPLATDPDELHEDARFQYMDACFEAMELEQTIEELEPLYLLVMDDAPVFFKRDFGPLDDVSQWGHYIRPWFRILLEKKCKEVPQLRKAWRDTLKREGFGIQLW